MARAILFATDLMFGSKVLATGRALNIDVRTVSSVDRLTELLAGGDARLVLVDMSLPVESACAAIRAAAEHASKPTIVAFYSHVQGEFRDAALAAGAHEVMPRSKLSAEVEAVVRKYCLD